MSLVMMNKMLVAPEEVTYVGDGRPNIQFSVPADYPPQMQAMQVGMFATQSMN
jgi:hypothetical protein